MVTRKPYMVWIENWTKDPNWTKVASKIRNKVARRAKTDKILYRDADRILIESSAPPARLQGYGTIAPWALWMISDAHENTWDIIKCAIAANQVSEQTLGWHGISSPNLVHEEWIAICPPDAIAGVWKMWGHPLKLARVDFTTWNPLTKQGEACVETYRRLLHMSYYVDKYACAGQSREGWRARLREVRENQAKWLMCPWAAPKIENFIESTIFAPARWALKMLKLERE